MILNINYVHNIAKINFKYKKAKYVFNNAKMNKNTFMILHRTMYNNINVKMNVIIVMYKMLQFMILIHLNVKNNVLIS